jgi:Fe-Mn family superoxide dismutase
MMKGGPGCEVPGSGFEGLSLVDIVRKAPAGAIFNNAGQILNHEMYFTQFKPAENVTLGT